MSQQREIKPQGISVAEVLVSLRGEVEEVRPKGAILWGRAAELWIGLPFAEVLEDQPALVRAAHLLPIGQTFWDAHSATLLQRTVDGLRLTVLLTHAAPVQPSVYLVSPSNRVIWCSNDATLSLPAGLADVVGVVDALLLEIELARARAQNECRRVRLRAAVASYLWADLTPIEEAGLVLMELRSTHEVTADTALLDVMEEAQSLVQMGSWYLKAGGGGFAASRGMEALIRWPKTFSPLHSSDLLDHLNTADHELYTQAVWACMVHQTPYDLQLMHLRSDGTEFLARLRGRAQLGPNGEMLGVIGSVVDISSFVGNETRISILADNLPEGAVFRRSEGRKGVPFTYASRGVMHLLGVTPAQLLEDHSRLGALIVEEERALYRESWAQALEMHTPFESTCKIINARTFEAHWVRISATPIYEAHAWHWDGVMIDVSRERQILEALTKAKEAAETAEALKTKFVAMMGHELRAPLSTISGMTRQLRRSKLAPPQRRFLDHLESSTQNLLKVLNDLLDFSKLSAGGFRLRHEIFELDALLAHVAAGTSVRASEKGLELVFVLDPQLPRKIYGDVLALGQVFINLVANAVKFTEQGQVTLRILRNPKSGRLRYIVRDTGPGIAQEMQARLFQAYAQEAGTPHFTGTGLGLMICQELVAEMGGQISFESEIGKGTVFYVDLPLHEVKEDPRDVIDLGGRTGAIISASADLRQSLLWQIDESQGIARVFASADDYLKAADVEDLQFVILDVPTGQADALEALRPLCARLAAQTRIFLLTSPIMDASLEAFAAEFSVAGLLTKPVSRHLLAERLAQSFESGSKEKDVMRDGEAKGGGFGGKSVLLVDDDALSTEVIADMLSDLGVRSEILNEGGQAIALVKKQRFDAVFLDLRMPVMNGYEVIAQLRADPKLRYLKIFAMTAEDRHGTQDELLALGFDAVLMKPLDETMLQEILERFWQRLSYRFDYQKILGRYSGNERRAQSSIALFVRDFEARSLEVSDPAISRERLGRIVHSIKGTAAYVQADHLESLAVILHRYLERDSAEDDSNFAQIVGDFREEFAHVIAVLKDNIEPEQAS